MDISRIWHTMRLCTITSGKKRGNYLRKKKVFRSIGENVAIMGRKIPLYPQCIKFHSNIIVASNVLFVTHDATDRVLNNYLKEKKCQEIVGCIEVHDNVFIGSNVTILNNVSIGPNAIVAAGSVINKDVPPNSIYGGVPAKFIGKFDEYLEKRKEPMYPEKYAIKNHKLNEEVVEYLWDKFTKEKENIK